MRQFKHPNVLPCLASYVSGSEVILVTPKMYWGSLKDLVETHFNHNEGIPELAVALIFKQVILALQYLHAKAIVHRSVRASHILISESGEAKLSGLRYACSLLHPAHGTVQDRYDYPLHVVKTNMNWLSPEFLQQVHTHDLISMPRNSNCFRFRIFLDTTNSLISTALASLPVNVPMESSHFLITRLL